MATFTDITAALANQLQFVAPVNLGRRSRPVNSSPPQYTIFPMRETYGPPQVAGASSNPRLLHARLMEIEVHSWGADYAPTEALNAAFITALRSTLSGANYKIGTATWIDAVDLDYGYVIVLPVTFIMAMPAAAIPATAAIAAQNPATYGVVDAVLPTKTITAITPDNTTTVQGDGFLDWGESS